MRPWLAKAEVRRGGLPSRVTFQDVLLVRISIVETSDNGES